MTREEAILYLEHTSSDDFNLEEHQIQNRLNAIQFLLKENQELKKQLEEERQKVKEYSYKLCNFRCEETYENQQKEFIKYLEDEIKYIKVEWGNKLTDKSYLDIAITVNAYEEILQKYKEIIGDVKNEN